MNFVVHVANKNCRKREEKQIKEKAKLLFNVHNSLLEIHKQSYLVLKTQIPISHYWSYPRTKDFDTLMTSRNPLICPLNFGSDEETEAQSPGLPGGLSSLNRGMVPKSEKDPNTQV